MLYIDSHRPRIQRRHGDVQYALPSAASTIVPQHFAIKLPRDPRLAASFLRARSDHVSPFGAWYLGLGRLVIEATATPYVIYARWRPVGRTCPLWKCGRPGKKGAE